MDTKTLYEKQVETLKKTSSAFGGMAFVPKDFRCYKCRKDLLTNSKIKTDAEQGVLITGCPFCNTSFCE